VQFSIQERYKNVQSVFGLALETPVHAPGRHEGAA